MHKPERTAKEWQALCILLIVVVLFLAWGWYSSDRKRAGLIEELEAKEAQITEMEREIDGLYEMLENNPG